MTVLLAFGTLLVWGYALDAILGDGYQHGLNWFCATLFGLTIFIARLPQ